MKKLVPINFKNTILAIATAGILSIGSLLSNTAWTTLALTATVATLSSSSAVYADGQIKPKVKRIVRCPGYPKTRNTPGTYGSVSGYSSNYCKYIVSSSLGCSSIAAGCHDVGAPQPSSTNDKTKKICICPPIQFKVK